MARPRIEIDKESFEKLCGLQCTLDEIASWFNCSQDTIERWCQRTYSLSFADTYKIHSASGKITLRRYQFKQAEKSTAMAIWLGKQWLGQSDKMILEGSIDPLTIKDIEDKVLKHEPDKK